MLGKFFFMFLWFLFGPDSGSGDTVINISASLKRIPEISESTKNVEKRVSKALMDVSSY